MWMISDCCVSKSVLTILNAAHLLGLLFGQEYTPTPNTHTHPRTYTYNTATEHQRSCSYGNDSPFYCSHLYTKSVLEIHCDEKGYLFTLVKLSFLNHM